VKLEPGGVINARNELRRGAGEINRVRVTPTFKTLLDGFLIQASVDRRPFTGPPEKITKFV
jgi:hypothetical protein